MLEKELREFSLEEKVGQLFFIGVRGAELDQATAGLLDDVRPGGICLFSRNIKTAEQTRELTDAIQRHLSVPALLSLDQEGGLVDRLRKVVTPMPAPATIKTDGQAQAFGRLVAEAIRILGFNINFAPVVDVIGDDRPSSGNGLESRVFGKNVNETIELAGAFLTALEDVGCLGCLKHFPGLGASRVDSHEELPLVEISDDEMSSVDLLPYRQLLSDSTARVVMVAHAAFPNSRYQEKDEKGRFLPSSISRGFVTGLLRDHLEFDGLVVTDDLEMGAIVKNFGVGEACVRAVEAGVDMVAICASENAIRDGYSAVLDAVLAGRVSIERIDRSLSRIQSIKLLAKPALQFDTNRLSELSQEIEKLKDEL